MAMVDASYRYVCRKCGFPGNSHDAVIFQSKKLYSGIKEGNFIPQICEDVNGVQVAPVVVGDSAFPLSSWLVKPYTNAVPTPKQYYFKDGKGWSLIGPLGNSRVDGACCRGNVKVT